MDFRRFGQISGNQQVFDFADQPMQMNNCMDPHRFLKDGCKAKYRVHDRKLPGHFRVRVGDMWDSIILGYKNQARGTNFPHWDIVTVALSARCKYHKWTHSSYIPFEYMSIFGYDMAVFVRFFFFFFFFYVHLKEPGVQPSIPRLQLVLVDMSIFGKQGLERG